MQRVLYVMASEHFSGAEIVTERLILANTAAVTPIALCSPGPFAQRLRDAGVLVVEEPSLAFLDRGRVTYSPVQLVVLLLRRLSRASRTLARVRREHGCEVIHAIGIVSAFYVLPSVVWSRAFARRSRWLWSNFDLRFPDGERSATLARWCTRWFHRTIAASQAVKERFGAMDDRTVVIHGGIDTERFAFRAGDRAALRAQLGLSEDDRLIGIVGSIEMGKGHHLLLEAVQSLAADHPEITLVIVGRFAVEPMYQARIEALVAGSAGRVRLLGFRPDVARLFSGLDILVNATTSAREEPLGTTIYEAMSCERIVVATATGGTTEIITDGVDGHVCAPDSADVLAGALRAVLARWTELEPMRRAARATVAARFGTRQMVARYSDLLEGL